MSKIIISVLLIAGFLAGCSKQDEQTSAGHAARSPTVASPAPTNPPLQLTITNPALSGSAPPADNAMIEKGYVVRDSGNLFLTYPKAWKDAILRMQQGKAGYDAVRFLPTNGTAFEMMIDFHHPKEQLYDTMDLKAQLAKIGERELTNSVENSLDIHDFSGSQINGYYFVITDKNYNKNTPTKGQFPYLTQGYAKLGGMVIGFRLVCNQLSPVQDQMLQMLKTARVEKKP